MKKISLILTVVLIATIAVITPGCITIEEFDFEAATEVVEFVDTVLTMLENHGLDLTGIKDHVVGMIEDHKKDDQNATAREIMEAVLRELSTLTSER